MINWRSEFDRELYEKYLVPIIKEQPTALFIGAGLSISAGYPLLKDLIKLLHERALEQNNNIALNGDWKNQAQICKDELGDDYYNILIDRFDPENNPARFTAIHTNLVQIKCNSIITTNYDACIELACHDLA